MTSDHVVLIDIDDLRMRSAIDEMKTLILRYYPLATFEAGYGDDPEGVYLTATVDLEDTDEVVDVYIDRLLDLQIEEGIGLHVIPLRAPERIAAMLRDRPTRPRAEALPR